MSAKEILERHYKFIVTHRMSHGEVEAHKARGELLDALKETKRSRDLCHRIAGCDQFNCCLDGNKCPEAILDKL